MGSTSAKKVSRDDHVNVEKRFKVITVGVYGVGKTSLILRYFDDQFREEIPRANPFGNNDFRKRKTLTNFGGDIVLEVHDTMAEEMFRHSQGPGLTRSGYYHYVHGIILTFDLSDPETLPIFLNRPYSCVNYLIHHYAPNATLILVGTKSDRPVAVTRENIDSFMAEFGQKMEYFETSAKEGLNVETMFHRLVELMLAKEQ